MRHKDFYVYLYLREDKTPYYVGKGRNRRAYNNHKHTPVPPRDRIILLKENLTNEEAMKLEKTLISFYRRKCEGGLLINLTEGGEGLEGHKHTEETKRKISEKKKGCRAYFVAHTEESKEKLRQAQLGRKASPETRKKLSEQRKGRVPWNKGKKWVMGCNSREAVVRNSTPVICDGVFYETVRDAAKVYNVVPNTIYKRCNNPNFPNFTW